VSRLSSAEAPATPDASTPAITGEDQARARLDSLVTTLGDDVLTAEVVRNGDLLIRVAATAWKRTAEVCKDQGYDYFCFVSGLDWMPSTSPNPRASVSDELDTGDDEAPAERGEEDEEAEAVADNDAAVPVADADIHEAGGLGYPTGVGGGDTRFQVFARLYSTTRHEGVTFKADLDPDNPHVETWSEVYPGADWNERETWEMYGFVFDGHPNLVKLYLPGEFEGFPLRKDFPLLSREVKPWPGLVDVELMPEVPESEAEAEPAAEAPAAVEPAAEAEAEPPADESPPEDAPAAEAATEPEPAAEATAEDAPAAAPADPAAPTPAEDSMPDTAEEAHATGTESATTGAAAEAAPTPADADGDASPSPPDGEDAG
jgi:NADH-quinone oxidoreductase subunit C